MRAPPCQSAPPPTPRNARGRGFVGGTPPAGRGRPGIVQDGGGEGPVAVMGMGVRTVPARTLGGPRQCNVVSPQHSGQRQGVLFPGAIPSPPRCTIGFRHYQGAGGVWGGHAARQGGVDPVLCRMGMARERWPSEGVGGAHPARARAGGGGGRGLQRCTKTAPSPAVRYAVCSWACTLR